MHGWFGLGRVGLGGWVIELIMDRSFGGEGLVGVVVAECATHIRVVI